MNCSLQGCEGTYETREIVHTVRHKGQVIVIDRVPAEVCSICVDVLLTPETVRHIESILRDRGEPERMTTESLSHMSNGPAVAGQDGPEPIAPLSIVRPLLRGCVPER